MSDKIQGTTRRTFLKQAGTAAVGLTCAQLLPGCGHHERGGKRYTMVVDLKKCQAQEGCKDCIRACHRTHNVPDIENERHEIKWLWKEEYARTFPDQENRYAAAQAPTLVACNHCEHPSCVKVCPTKATWQREADGIVMMDMHRCIGCRYCMAACPYGSRSFNWMDPPWPKKDGKSQVPNPNYPHRMRGVVEKCSFCAERLVRGQQPLCVETCKHGALTFGDANDPNSPVRKLLASRHAIRRKVHLGTDPHIFYLV
jgi:molybdopterin-containing oxidoreductase family iron-sulfur binding subunit